MKVFLMRHAHADYGPPDPDRRLSTRGQECARRMAGFAAGRDFFDFAEIWCSPYLRARETAEPFASLNGGALKIHYTDSLVPHADPSVVLARLNSREGSVLLVGHNPHLSLLAGMLLGIDPARTHLPFKKGAIMAFESDPYSESGYSLQAFLTPSSLGA
jgi:phosphohistidine phosphatase